MGAGRGRKEVKGQVTNLLLRERLARDKVLISCTSSSSEPINFIKAWLVEGIVTHVL